MDNGNAGRSQANLPRRAPAGERWVGGAVQGHRGKSLCWLM